MKHPETVRVKADNQYGFAIINKDDFNPEEHELYEDQPTEPVKTPEPSEPVKQAEPPEPPAPPAPQVPSWMQGQPQQ